MNLRNALLFIGLLLLTACQPSFYEGYQNAFAITNVSTGFDNFYEVGVTVENTSNLEMGCWAEIKLKKGNTIIDRSTIIFSNLQPGESEQDEAWLSDVKSEADYESMVITLYWTVDDVGYERTYNY